ncbi:MAG: hypothetical protein GIX02_13155 [Candidatus Eremiobacteraeota bacterium]|nr:hypothetical protein [Candidatus Eremiobacteraeota bacterium]
MAIVSLALIAAAWRPVGAWWYDDIGNLALAKGSPSRAVELFDRGLALAPDSRVLLEDRGRARLPADPGGALADLKRAACGTPCIAEEGDAQLRLGNARQAVADYLAARAAPRLAQSVKRMTAIGQYDEAIALESALIARLRGDVLYRADLAAAYETLGKLEESTAYARQNRAPAYRRVAIEAHKRASELAPFNEGYLLSYGFAQAQWGDPRAARAAFARELALHPHQADAEKALQTLLGSKAREH